MTDTTDIKALREFLECEIIPNGILRNFANKVLSQLEAERQQREAAEAELAELRGEQEPVLWALINKQTQEIFDYATVQPPQYRSDASFKVLPLFSHAVIKPENQTPLAEIVVSKNWPDTGKKVIDYYLEKIQHLPVGTKLFTAAQKPVVVKLPAALMPAIHNSGELFMTPDNVEQGGYLNRDDVTRVLRAAGIVVKDGE